ncbi:MAG: 4Fe-4S binding protein [Desulfobacterales bacterium]|nr:4Fe-4S binding protein [Desulfobacterales bacterium]
MLRRSFFNLGATPKLHYPVLSRTEAKDIREIPLPEKAVLLYRGSAALVLKTGDKLRTGQKLASGEDILVSPVTGTVTEISPYKGTYGRSFTAISVKVESADVWDEEFVRICKEGNIETLGPYLSALPGKPDLARILKAEPPVHTVVVPVLDKDILISTSQYLLHRRTDEVRGGVEQLRRLAGSARIVIAVPAELASVAEKTGAEVKVVTPVFPNAHPGILAREIVRKKKGLSEDGVAFLSLEAVIGLNALLGSGEFPVNKVFTVIGKDHSFFHVRARVGTPVKDVLEALGIRTGHGDRLISGGPMSGEAIYWEETPVMGDTDGILVQGKDQIQQWSDTHCINCGECVRACPSRVQVNMLIRFLENGLYQEAADLYDLMNCIECGLCGYVCPARIPLFQYIMLGKHECERKKAAEVANG